MQIKFQKQAVLFVSLFCGGTAFASGGVKPFSTENEWNSASIAASGGIGSLSENHTDQFFSDPSLIAKNKKRFSLQLFGAHVFFSGGLKDTVSEINELTAGNSESEGNKKTLETINGLKKIFGRRLSGGLNINLFSMKIGPISVVPYASALLDAEARVPAYPRVSAVADAYTGFGLGYATTIGKFWEVGANIRPGTRVYATASIDSSTIGEDLTGGSEASSGTDEIAKQGTGVYVPVDMAVGFNPNKEWRFNLVMRNVGGAPALSSTDSTPPVYPMRVSLGATWNVYEKGFHKIELASELQDLLNIASHDNALLYRWQWGGAYKFRLSSRSDTSLGINTGLQSGYAAIGAFVDLFFVTLEGALYTVESAAFTGQRAEQRYAIKAHTQFAF